MRLGKNLKNGKKIIVAKKTDESVEDNDVTEIDASCVGDEDEQEEKEIDFIGPSDAMKELLRVLEFNAIDMYR